MNYSVPENCINCGTDQNLIKKTHKNKTSSSQGSNTVTHFFKSLDIFICKSCNQKSNQIRSSFMRTALSISLSGILAFVLFFVFVFIVPDEVTAPIFIIIMGIMITLFIFVIPITQIIEHRRNTPTSAYIQIKKDGSIRLSSQKYREFFENVNPQVDIGPRKRSRFDSDSF